MTRQMERRDPAGSKLRYFILTLLFCCYCVLTAVADNRVPVIGGAESSADGAFTFVVHGDLTGGERAGVFSTAAAQIALLHPAFVISVGDLIEGDGKNAMALDVEWESYEARARTTGAPVYLVGGNHDLTSSLQRDTWERRYGPTYYHFRRGDALFLVLDTEDYPDTRREEIAAARFKAVDIYKSEGQEAFARTDYATMPERVYGEIGAEQLRYFEAVLANNSDVRWTFLFMHKAAWQGSGHRRFHALEEALATRAYTVFHGHEHAYRYLERRGREYLRLATTGGVQMPEGGRSADHLTLVTVGSTEVHIANLDLSGIRDREGEIPANGGTLCFESVVCGQD
jgi:hypothetical protein